MKTLETNKPDITLSTGRVVRHTRMANGANDASMADGGDMSEAEWDDYCAILAKRTLPCSRAMECSGIGS